MFERFTDTAREIVVQAQANARRLGRTWIGCEHRCLRCGFPPSAWRHPLRGEEFSDGRDAQAGQERLAYDAPALVAHPRIPHHGHSGPLP
jgi:hypothetical protein